MEAFSAVKSAFKIEEDLSKSKVSIFDIIKPLFPSGIPGKIENSPIFLSGIPYSLLIGAIKVEGLQPTDINVFIGLNNIILHFAQGFKKKAASSFNDTEKQIARYVISTMANSLNNFTNIVDASRLNEYTRFFSQYGGLIPVAGQDDQISNLYTQVQQISQYFEACASAIYSPRTFSLSSDLMAQLKSLSQLAQSFMLFETLTGDVSFSSQIDAVIYNIVVEIIASASAKTVASINDTIKKFTERKQTLGATSFASIRSDIIDEINATLSKIAEDVQKSLQGASQSVIKLPPETDFPTEFSNSIIQILTMYASQQLQPNDVVQTLSAIQAKSTNTILTAYCKKAIANPKASFGATAVAGSLLPYGINASVTYFCSLALAYPQYATAMLKDVSNAQVDSLVSLLRVSASSTTISDIYVESISSYLINLTAAIKSFAVSLYVAAASLLNGNKQAEEDFQVFIQTNPFAFDLQNIVCMAAAAESSIKVIHSLGLPELAQSEAQLNTLVSNFLGFTKGNEAPANFKEHVSALAAKICESIEKKEIERSKVEAFTLAAEMYAFSRKEYHSFIEDLVTYGKDIKDAEHLGQGIIEVISPLIIKTKAMELAELLKLNDKEFQKNYKATAQATEKSDIKTVKELCAKARNTDSVMTARRYLTRVNKILVTTIWQFQNAVFDTYKMLKTENDFVDKVDALATKFNIKYYAKASESNPRAATLFDLTSLLAFAIAYELGSPSQYLDEFIANPSYELGLEAIACVIANFFKVGNLGDQYLSLVTQLAQSLYWYRDHKNTKYFIEHLTKAVKVSTPNQCGVNNQMYCTCFVIIIREAKVSERLDEIVGLLGISNYTYESVFPPKPYPEAQPVKAIPPPSVKEDQKPVVKEEPKPAKEAPQPESIPTPPPPPPKDEEPKRTMNASPSIDNLKDKKRGKGLEKFSLRLLRLVEQSRQTMNALEKYSILMTEDKYKKFTDNIEVLASLLSETSDSWTRAVLQSVQDLSKSVESHNATKDYNSDIDTMSRIMMEIIEHSLSGFGLASTAQAEMYLMNAKVDALQAEINDMASKKENTDAMRQLIIQEGGGLLKLTRNLSKSARQQCDFLILTNKSISNEARLINAAKQVADTAQMFFLLIKSTTPEDSMFIYKVVAAAKGMNQALTSLLVNFRQIANVNTEIQKKMEATVKDIQKTMTKIIEAAEERYGPDHDVNLENAKKEMTAHQLKVARMNASNDVLKKRRELEEAEEALKRFNRNAANKSRPQN